MPCTSLDEISAQAPKKAKRNTKKVSKFTVALKIPFRKSFEELGIGRIVRKTLENYASSSRAKSTGTAKFFNDVSVLVSYKSAQKIGDVLISMKH